LQARRHVTDRAKNNNNLAILPRPQLTTQYSSALPTASVVGLHPLDDPQYSSAAPTASVVGLHPLDDCKNIEAGPGVKLDNMQVRRHVTDRAK